MKKYNITVNGTVYEVEVEEVDASADTAAAPVQKSLGVPAVPKPAAAPKPAPKPAAKPAAAGALKISAPMPGNIIKILVSEGKAVKKGDILCLLEAMKMENEIVAPQDGVVASVAISQGASVNAGDLLFSLN
ncbi:MAG: acetyl-CoA carboxylase biotin carboxyl carrier protein subunit [Eubacteriales bacterium]